MKNLLLTACLVLTFATPLLAQPPAVHCPTEPPTVRRLQLQERWRVDGDDPDAPLLGYFYSNQVFVHDGRVYMLDGQLCHVLVYSDDGEYLDTIMREGDGPGEIRNPGAMKLCTGERIGVRHGYPTRIEFVDLDGTPSSSWRLQANAWAHSFQETPFGLFLVYSESKESDEPGEFSSIFHAALHDDEGLRTVDFFSEANQSSHFGGGAPDEADQYNPWLSAVVTADSQIVISAERDRYRLEWRNMQGEVTRVALRDFEAHRRTKAELDRIKYQSYSIVNDDLRFSDRKLCENDPVILRLTPGADGSLRVRTSFFEKDLPPGMVCRYEVHEPNGELRERVEIYDPTGDYDVEYDDIALLDDGRAMVLRNVRPSSRAAFDKRLHPKVQEKLPPIPDDREDMDFAPVMCDLVPYESP